MDLKKNEDLYRDVTGNNGQVSSYGAPASGAVSPYGASLDQGVREAQQPLLGETENNNQPTLGEEPVGAALPSDNDSPYAPQSAPASAYSQEATQESAPASAYSQGATQESAPVSAYSQGTTQESANAYSQETSQSAYNGVSSYSVNGNYNKNTAYNPETPAEKKPVRKYAAHLEAIENAYSVEDDHAAQDVRRKREGADYAALSDSPFINGSSEPRTAANRMSRTEYAAAQRKQRQKSNAIDTARRILIAVIVLFAIIPLCVTTLTKFTADSPVKKIVNAVNNRTTSSKNVVKAFAPYFLTKAYNDYYSICDANVEYRNQLQTQEDQFKLLMEQLYDSAEASLGIAGSKSDIVDYEVTERTALTGEEKKAIQEAYRNAGRLKNGFKALFESIKGKTDLADKEVEDIEKVFTDMFERMEKVYVLSGYKLKVKFSAGGNTSDEIEIVTVFVNGHWMIDYISTMELASDDDYKITKTDRVISTASVSQLNLILKTIASDIKRSNDPLEETLAKIITQYGNTYAGGISLPGNTP